MADRYAQCALAALLRPLQVQPTHRLRPLLSTVDPFGHSLTQASLLSYAAGFDAVFLGRIDYADHALRYNQSRLEFIWRGNPTAGYGAGTLDQVFAQATPTGGYNAPRGLCWDQTCDDPDVQDDPSLTDYNLPERLQAFVNAAVEQGTHSNCPTDPNAVCNIMWMMGSADTALSPHYCPHRCSIRPLLWTHFSTRSLPFFLSLSWSLPSLPSAKTSITRTRTCGSRTSTKSSAP
jgi:hypothetical protein